LRDEILNDEKTRWKRISAKVGKSEKGCRRIAKEMHLAV
jgi:hypothetical protein